MASASGPSSTLQSSPRAWPSKAYIRLRILHIQLFQLALQLLALRAPRLPPTLRILLAGLALLRLAQPLARQALLFLEEVEAVVAAFGVGGSDGFVEELDGFAEVGTVRATVSFCRRQNSLAVVVW